MPFINSKISTSLTEAQESEIKTRLGQAIQTIPVSLSQKAGSWSALNLTTSSTSEEAMPSLWLWSRSAFTAVKIHLPFLSSLARYVTFLKMFLASHRTMYM